MEGKFHHRTKEVVLLLVLLFCVNSTYAQLKKWLVVDSSLLLPAQKMQRWEDCKFGLFLHFGLYSILGKGEWVQFNEQISVKDYAKLKNRFDPEKGSAERWAEIAKEAGCKYMVLTARHHEGFSLFNTSVGDFNSVHSPAKRDIIKNYVAACRKEGMLVGIYYSPLDWRYPGFFFPGLYEASADSMKRQTFIQVRELMSHYGKIDILWYDGGGDDWLSFGGLIYTGNGWRGRDRSKVPYTGRFHWNPIKLNTMVRNLQPDIIFNSRSGMLGDYDEMEARFTKRENTKRPWEFCTTLQKYGWGYVKDVPILTSDSCIRLLAKVVCMNGNLLLDVGPMANGKIPPNEVVVLKNVGHWLGKYGESIYDTHGGIWSDKWGGTTTTPSAEYVHILNLPLDKVILLPPASGNIKVATNLITDEKVSFVQNKNAVILYGLEKEENIPDLIIKLSY